MSGGLAVEQKKTESTIAHRHADPYASLCKGLRISPTAAQTQTPHPSLDICCVAYIVSKRKPARPSKADYFHWQCHTQSVLPPGCPNQSPTTARMQKAHIHTQSFTCAHSTMIQPRSPGRDARADKRWCMKKTCPRLDVLFAAVDTSPRPRLPFSMHTDTQMLNGCNTRMTNRIVSAC